MSRSGTKLINLIQKRDPFDSQCNGKNCKPCEDKVSNKSSNCRTQNITYSATCKLCEKEGKSKIYYGETCRNLNLRSEEHYKDYKNKSKHSWMLKHMQNEHTSLDSEECGFRWKVMAKFKKPMQRQLSEAINIENAKGNEIMNLKNEYFKNNIKGINLYKNQVKCKHCGLDLEGLQELRSHIDYNHKPYKCKSCDYQAFGTCDLKNHTQITHGTNS